MQVADALTGSDLILTLQRRTCEELMKNHALSITEFPLKAPPINYYMFWHKRYDKDSTNRWLRQVCCDVLRGQVLLQCQFLVSQWVALTINDHKVVTEQPFLFQMLGCVPV